MAHAEESARANGPWHTDDALRKTPSPNPASPSSARPWHMVCLTSAMRPAWGSLPRRLHPRLARLTSAGHRSHGAGV